MTRKTSSVWIIAQSGVVLCGVCLVCSMLIMPVYDVCPNYVIHTIIALVLVSGVMVLVPFVLPHEAVDKVYGKIIPK